MKSLLVRLLRWLDTVQHPYLTLTIYFVLTRMVREVVRPFDASTLYHDMHFLDFYVLKDHLLHGLYYLHFQPPLFNFFLGLVIKAFPESQLHWAFGAQYALMGLVIVLTAYAVMVRIQISRGMAFVTAAALAVFPSMIQAETWLYYTYPATLMLVVCAWAILRALETHRLRYAALFFTSAGALVLMRSAFHAIVWLGPVVLLLVVLYGLQRGRKVLAVLSAAAVLTVSLAAAPYVINYVRWGVFQGSTWLGFSVYSMTFGISLGQPERVERLIAEGKVTPLARIVRYAPAEEYLAYYHETGKTGIDVLDTPRKVNGGINYNHFIFPRADAETYRNSMTIIKEFPWDYVKTVLNQAYIFFGFSPYRYFWAPPTFLIPRTTCWWFTVYDAVMVYLVPPVFFILFWRSVRAIGLAAWDALWSWPRNRARLGLFTYMLFTIAYVTLQTWFLVFGEGNYVRIPIDPLLAIGLAMVFDKALRSQP